jgi:flagellar biosynthesis protein FlhA
MKNKLVSIIQTSSVMVALVSFIAAIIIPLPGMIIDLALVVSFAVAITLYVSASSIRNWNELSTFPTILLLTAIFRIALNISTTRRILQDGKPGHIIESFGSFVVGSNIWIGFVIFIILIVFQFIVANGLARTSEVAARFTLDSLPGKQMSIDNDLQQGNIGKEEAKEARTNLDMEVDFYGNMDGAGKYIKGDVVAGITLVVVNIVFGMIIGTVVGGMSITEAAYRYTLLTMGDGIVNQICSLLIAISAGIVMTRVYNGSEKNILINIFGELTKNPTVLNVVGTLFLLFGFVMPSTLIAFGAIAAVMFYLAYKKSKRLVEEQASLEGIETAEREEDKRRAKERVDVVSEIEPIILELGIQLAPLVIGAKSGELKQKIIFLRQEIARELGVRIPYIKVIDNSSLSPYHKYNILIKDITVASGELKINEVLAMKTPFVVKELVGYNPTRDPVFHEEAVWIPEDQIETATKNGYKILDPLSILSTHLNEVIRQHMHEFIQRQEIHNMLTNIEARHEALVSEVKKSETITLATIQRVVQNLLREGLSVRNLPEILESIIDCKTHDNIDVITSMVRENMAKYICNKYADNDGKLYVLLLDPLIEKLFPGRVATHTNGSFHLQLRQQEEELFVQSLTELLKVASATDVEPVILTTQMPVRFGISRLLNRYNLSVPVMSTNELVPGVRLERIGFIQTEAEAS